MYVRYFLLVTYKSTYNRHVRVKDIKVVKIILFTFIYNKLKFFMSYVLINK